ncbi:MAG TPA: hypothetical protein VF602_07365, partial [Pedobacter sp.]
MRKRRTNTPHSDSGVSLVCGLFTIIISLSVLVGWSLVPEVMTGPAANFIGTNPVSAVIFFLFGCWLIVMLKGSQTQISYLTTIVFFISFSVALSKVADVYYNTGFDADTLLFTQIIN